MAKFKTENLQDLNDSSLYEVKPMVGSREGYFVDLQVYNPNTNLESPYADSITSATRLHPSMSNGVIPPRADEIRAPGYVNPYLFFIGLYLVLYKLTMY